GRDGLPASLFEFLENLFEFTVVKRERAVAGARCIEVQIKSGLDFPLNGRNTKGSNVQEHIVRRYLVTSAVLQQEFAEFFAALNGVGVHRRRLFSGRRRRTPCPQPRERR